MSTIISISYLYHEDNSRLGGEQRVSHDKPHATVNKIGSNIPLSRKKRLLANNA